MNDPHNNAFTGREALIDAMARAWWEQGNQSPPVPWDTASKWVREVAVARALRLLDGGAQESSGDRAALAILQRRDDGDHAGDDYRRERAASAGDHGTSSAADPVGGAWRRVRRAGARDGSSRMISDTSARHALLRQMGVVARGKKQGEWYSRDTTERTGGVIGKARQSFEKRRSHLA